MTMKKIDDAILTDIADAIREKNRTSDKFHPHSMAQQIRNIDTGTQDILTEVTVTPSEEGFTINPVPPNTGFYRVIVNPIPSNYGKINWNGNRLKVF